jgi:hypothetical protein
MFIMSWDDEEFIRAMKNQVCVPQDMSPGFVNSISSLSLYDDSIITH